MKIISSFVFCVCLAVVTTCPAADIMIWRRPTADGLPVTRALDITYFKGKDADAFRHRLDLFVPKDKKDFPVVILVHGGSWVMGDNRCFGLYSSVGEFLASRGI